MNILVLHNIEDFRRVRRSTLDYLLCFERYQPLHSYHYQRILDPPPKEVSAARWDAVIMDSTALGIVTVRPQSRYFQIRDHWEFLRKPGIVKLVLPQDDANCGGLMDDWFSDWGVQFVFSVRARKHWPVLYPRSVKSAEFQECLPGYIDDASLPGLRTYSKAWTKRSRLIGQRVTMYPPRGGRQGRMKGVIAQAVRAAAAKRGLKADISTDPADTFFGDDWYRFLGDCQHVLATEGGLSIHDPYGEIADRIDAFTAGHPGASFDEIEAACFPGLDGQHVFSGFTPRILEAAVCGASQVLVEGDYLGVLEPGVHYLPVKQNGSDIETVLDGLGDRAAALARIAACDRILVDNSEFRYSALATRALAAISGKASPRKKPGPAFDAAASGLSYIDRLADQQRSAGFRWPELGQRVAETIVSQLVPDRRDPVDAEFVRYRAFVKVFQNELGRLSSRTEVNSAAGRFVETFQQTASAWQNLASQAWSGPAAEAFKAMADAFAGVHLDASDEAEVRQSTAPILSAFGASPEIAALAEDVAGLPSGSDIARFARAAARAGLHGLACRLAPAQGNSFTFEEAARLQRLDGVIIRSAGEGLDSVERFQAHAPQST
ncbi:MAG: hypothetical protein GC152_14805, partial [Alphaproteobacteria bacterium]|nr:hypothetical protein [Alphaproteobacteria bacterium]